MARRLGVDRDAAGPARSRPGRRRCRRRLDDHVRRAPRPGARPRAGSARSSSARQARSTATSGRAGRAQQLAADLAGAPIPAAIATLSRPAQRRRRQAEPFAAVAPALDAAPTRPRLSRYQRTVSLRARLEASRDGAQPSSRPTLRGVDGVAVVVARPVGDEGDQLGVGRRRPGAHSSSGAQIAATTSMLRALGCRRRYCSSRRRGRASATATAPRA